ncbi:hypothetical protein [uncultured Tenacibaculum sp.]|uniref:hypothetical protein n=1 Tax=uncultured Tenacibaculum sp. TaxID=174713 RepID=UPI002635BFC1|nr:hypothetical protein [uncultured Tenacibaculum sp.]
MIHLIWSIINLTIVFFFIYLIIGFIKKGKQIFKPQFKIVSILIMLIGVLQIISASNSKKNSNKISITKNYNKQSNIKRKQVILENNLTFDINMQVKYSVDQNDYIPVESNSSLTGFVTGYEWKFKSINTKKLDSNGKAEFIANGILDWNLFGITVYGQNKIFTGIIE